MTFSHVDMNTLSFVLPPMLHGTLTVAVPDLLAPFAALQVRVVLELSVPGAGEQTGPPIG